MDFDYDGGADVMYISFGPSEPALCVADDDFETINYRLDFKTRELVGVTVWGYLHWDRKQLIAVLQRTTEISQWPLPN
jgi:uncharacterized protein YuzE